MTIYLYTGTPGSGKSYHMARDILYKTNRKNFNKVIGNFPVEIPNQKNYIYKDTFEMSPEYFIEYAKKNHQANKESQTLICIDESALIFNSREWNTKGNQRLEWIEFFIHHRKFGYNVILVSQFDRMIDRQIRSLVEYEVAHYKINNYFKIIPVTAFMAVTRWYGQKLKVSHETIIYRKKIGSIYNTFKIF